jgi:hypothetical protein
MIGTTKNITIASGQTKSAAIDLGDNTLVGLIIPAAFTGIAVTFEASDDIAGTYYAVKGSDGTSISYTVAAGTYVMIQPAVLAGVRNIKVVSGSSEGADRVIKGICRRCD